MQTLEKDEQLISYLLDELDGKQREELEEQFERDRGLFERMLALRDDLIDDYLRDELSARQRRQFERRLLATPQQRERVENARVLMRAVAAESAATPISASQQAEKISIWQHLRILLRSNQLVMGAAAAMSLLVFTIAGLLLFEMLRLRNQLAGAGQRQQVLQQQVTEERARSARLSDELAQARTQGETPPELTPPPRPEPDVIASLILTSDYDQGARGGGGQRKLVLLPGRGVIQLQLKLAEAAYPNYRLTLKEVSSGRTIRTWTGLRVQQTHSGKSLNIKLPASSFTGPAKDYIVILDGRVARSKYESEIDKYSFQVDKK